MPTYSISYYVIHNSIEFPKEELKTLNHFWCQRKARGKNSYLNRAANGTYRLKFFRDVKNSRTNYMFIYYAYNAAYRRLAEGFQ